MDNKTIAWVSYLTIIGWIVAIASYGKEKSEFVAFHLRQSLGIFLTFVAVFIVASLGMAILPWSMWYMWLTIIRIAQLAILGALIYGLVEAINEKQTPTPLLGDFYQKILKGIG